MSCSRRTVSPLKMDYISWITALVMLLFPALVQPLRDVVVLMPSAVKRGENAILQCRYDLEGDSLYSVKWYKGRREFFRYTPKEIPAMRTFPAQGVQINKLLSNESHIVLNAVQMQSVGKYSCEVSADAPSFHTLYDSADLKVVETPDSRPHLSGFRTKYKPGEIVRGNCTSKHSRPAANLTWTINNKPAGHSHIKVHRVLKQENDLETSILGIHFVATANHFAHGKLRIRCTARIHDIYWQTAEKTIEEERPRIYTVTASSAGQTSNNINWPGTLGEYFSNDASDKYDAQFQGDSAMSNRSPSVQQSHQQWNCSFLLTVLIFYHLMG